MVVLGVLVQHKLAKVVHWELISGPDLGDVERIESERFWVGVFRLHDLHLGRPLDLAAVLDDLPEVALAVVWVLARDADSFWLGELLLAMLGNEVVFDVDKLALLVHPLESMTAVSCRVLDCD